MTHVFDSNDGDGGSTTLDTQALAHRLDELAAALIALAHALRNDPPPTPVMQGEDEPVVPFAADVPSHNHA